MSSVITLYKGLDGVCFPVSVLLGYVMLLLKICMSVALVLIIVSIACDKFNQNTFRQGTKILLRFLASNRISYR